jgi:hypothetical protein
VNQEMRIVREVSMQAEGFYRDAESMGRHAAHALGEGEKRRAQMTGLENIAEGALKTSDVFDYIKKQTARFEEWRKGYTEGDQSWGPFGLRLKDYLEGEIARRRDIVCGPNILNISNQTEEGRRERQRIYLLLIRQFIRQMVAQYEFSVKFGSGEGKGDGNRRQR